MLAPARVRNPYPAHYRPAFAFSTFPYPQPHPHALRLAFPYGLPRWETYGLTTFRDCTCFRWVRFRLFAGDAPSAIGELGTPIPDPLPFWPKPMAPGGNSQHLWLVLINDVYQRFRCLNPTTPSWLPTAPVLAVATIPRGLMTSSKAEATLSLKLHTRPLPATHVQVGYRQQNTGLHPDFIRL
jgi:hypothetical protein